jgi:hypothetical protein
LTPRNAPGVWRGGGDAQDPRRTGVRADSAAQQFPYLMIDPNAGAASLSPYLPVTLILGEQQVSVMGLVDSGAAINVIPFDVGLHLGYFFLEFDVCFFRSHSLFEVRPKSSTSTSAPPVAG